MSASDSEPHRQTQEASRALADAIDEALRQLGELRDSSGEDLGPALQAVEAMLLHAGGRDGEAVHRLEAAIERARAQGNAVVAVWLEARRGLWEIAAGWPGPGAERVEEAVDRLLELGRPWAALQAADDLVRALRRVGEIARARAVGARLQERPWPPEVLERAILLRVTHAETALFGGMPEVGDDELRRACARAELHHFWRPLYQAAMARALFAVTQGRIAEAEHDAARARQLAVTHRDPHRYLAAAQLLADLAERRGDRAAAYGTIVRAVRSLRQLLGPSFDATGERLLAALKERWGEADYRAAAQAFVESARDGTLGR